MEFVISFQFQKISIFSSILIQFQSFFNVSDVNLMHFYRIRFSLDGLMKYELKDSIPEEENMYAIFNESFFKFHNTINAFLN